MKRFVWSCGVFATVVFAGATALDAQGVTTAAIAGVVTDSSGGPLEGGRVVAVHGPSGTAYAAVTRADGRFTIPGMRVGGPYRVTVALVGYRREVQDQISLTLGVTTDLRFALGPLRHTNSDPAGHGNSTPLNTNEYDRSSFIGFEDLTSHPVQCVIHFAGFHELVVQLQRHGGPRLYARFNRYE